MRHRLRKPIGMCLANAPEWKRSASVVMCLENAYHYYKGRIRSISASNADYLVRLTEKLNEFAGVECFGICYDSGHANITGKDQYREILTIGKHLKVLHLHDTEGVHDTHLILAYSQKIGNYLPADFHRKALICPSYAAKRRLGTNPRRRFLLWYQIEHFTAKPPAKK